MTKGEAIQELQNCKGLIQQDGQDYLDERDFPLLDMAIEALSANAVPHGRLIDADTLIFELEEWKKNPNNDDSSVDLVNHFIGIIRATSSAEQVAVKLNNPCDSLLTEESNGSKEYKSKLESADAVAVVRCKDCRHYKSDGGALMVCDVSDMVVDDTDYCSYGERRKK